MCSPGNVMTFATLAARPLGFEMFSGVFKPEKKKSSEVTCDLQGNPYLVGEAWRSATQKSCIGLGFKAERVMQSVRRMKTLERKEGICGILAIAKEL